MGEKVTQGKPWEVVKTLTNYGKADAVRNSLKEQNPTWEVKVKKTADDNFNVKVRKPPTNLKPQKKNKKAPKQKIK